MTATGRTESGALTKRSLAAAVEELARRDADFAGVVVRHGLPPLWDRRPGFGTLVHIMLEQQVSLASAQAAFDRLRAAVDPLTPAGFLRLTDAELLAIGFSRQKTRYVRALASAILSGELDVEALARLPDDEARLRLTSLVGIGPWTADIYLLMALGRPDIWPATDIALVSALAELKRLPRRPSFEEMAQLGEAWRPWRSVAARLLWLDYLGRRGRL